MDFINYKYRIQKRAKVSVDNDHKRCTTIIGIVKEFQKGLFTIQSNAIQIQAGSESHVSLQNLPLLISSLKYSYKTNLQNFKTITCHIHLLPYRNK